MQTFTLLSTVSFILIFNNFLSAQGNCLPSSHCSTATELIISADIEENMECNDDPSLKEGKTITINSCNSFSEKNSSYFESDCIAPNQHVVWYKFNTGNYEHFEIKISKGGDNPIKAFGVDLFTQCLGYSALNHCGFAGLNDYQVIFSENIFEENTDFYLAIGSKLKDTGTFEIQIELFDLGIDMNICADEPAIIIPDKLPPYNTGDIVVFDVFIPGFFQTQTIQWLQGVLPVFGTGWDPTSFTYIGGPPSEFQVPNTNWQWWEEENVKVNYDLSNIKTFRDKLDRLNLCYGEYCPEDNEGCLLAEQYLPAGWYAYQDGAGPYCEPESGHPNLGWGDGQGPWTFTFSLKVGDPEELGGDTDLSIAIHLLSDQQTGCWSPSEQSCKLEAPGEIKAFNFNCNMPPVSAGPNLVIDCNVPEFSIVGSGPSDSAFIQYWGTVDGEILGPNDSYEIIANSGGSYRLYLEDTITGCVTYDEMRVDFNQINFEMDVNDVICHGEMSGSIDVITNGSILWSTGESGNSITDLAPGNYRFTITEGNCEMIQTFQINQPVKGIQIDFEAETGETSSEINLEISGGWGDYEIEWFFAGNSIANNITKLTVDQEGDYTVIVTDDKGCVETIIINIDFTSSIINFGNNETIRVFPNPAQNILYIEGDIVQEIISYEIINMTGQTLFKGKNGIESGQLNVAHLTPSQYILKLITTDGRQGVMKFIKE